MRDDTALPLLDEAVHHRLRLELAGLPFRPLTPPRHHHVILDGRRFHYVEWGEASAPPILFLHGGGQTCRSWDVVCHELSQRYRCLALDQRGHGDSEWSYEFDYGLAAYGGDVGALVDALGLQRPVVVGMSLGGMAGLRYVLDRPGEAAGFVAVDVGPWINVPAAAPIRNFMAEVSTLDQLDQFVEASLRFNPRRDPRLLRTSLLHNLRRCPDGRLVWKTDLRQREDRVAELTASLEQLRRGLPELDCPVLVVMGAESNVLGSENAQRFAEAVPNGRWRVIEGAGHSLQGDQPKALIEVLDGFFKEIGWATA
jgi:esterase